MPYLKYYANEAKKYNEYEIKMSKNEIIMFIHGVTAKFNVPSVKVEFGKMSRTLGYYRESKVKPIIKFSTEHDITLRIVAHELAHHFDVIYNGSYNKGYDLKYGRKKSRKAHTYLHEMELKKILKFYDELKGNIRKTKKKDIPTLTTDWKNVVIEI